MRHLRRPLLLGALLLIGSACGRVAPVEDPWRVNDEFVRAVNRGVHLMESYDYASAATAFEEALELSPDSTEARLRLAFAESNNYKASGDPGRAERLLDEVLAREPENIQALYLRGILHINAGEAEMALPLLEQVVKLEQHDAFAWYVLARAKRLTDQDAKVELRRAIAERPTLAGAWYDLFRCATAEGDEAEAERLLERFQALRKDRFKIDVSLPKYRMMGPLGVVHPLPVVQGALLDAPRLSFGEARTVLVGMAAGKRQGRLGLMLAAGDVDGDGDLDLTTLQRGSDGARALLVRLNAGAGRFVDASQSAAVRDVREPTAVAMGDFDNDGDVDLFVACDGPNHLLAGAGDGTFVDVTAAAGVAGPDGALTASAVFLDADHDADLDLYVCNLAGADGEPLANQLLRNNSDGTFTDIAADVAADCASVASLLMAPIDLDDDRDTDLIVFNEGAPITFLWNDLHEGYRDFDPIGEAVHGENGGVAQDFDGDGLPDLLIFAASERRGQLFVGEGRGRLARSPGFAGGRVGPARVADVDLDGDLDLAILAQGVHLLRNDGRGHFAPQGEFELPAVDLLDLTGDGVVDLLAMDPDAPGTLTLCAGELSPPATWLGLTVTGKLHVPKSMRSPKSGFGTKVRVQSGLHGQVLTQTGLAGGLGQSSRELIFGLDGADRSDYIALRWPDGVTQSETDLASNMSHVLPEVQRKPDSCPMLFAWNGRRFGFVGDFAGVGGLGYYAGPGAPPPPQAKELVRIDARALVARDGRLELRVCEPMQEVAYVDRLELLAVDHPQGWEVQPDERLVVSGSPPTQELLALERKFFPLRAMGPEGDVAVADLLKADRRYAYLPPHDSRFVGYCEPHQLVLEFGPELAQLDPARPTYLMLDGTLEFPYSQTNFASLQAGVSWDPPRVELRTEQGEWRTLVPDAGAPGGMMRTIAIDLSTKLPAGPCALRLTTNLEIYYDRVFIAQDRGSEHLALHSVPMARAELRRLGFPQEYSPDGGRPLVYNYDRVEPTCGLQRLAGRYTRYGPVEELLTEFDDRYVVMATGDEIAVDFDADALPPLGEGRERTYVLVSHAYCKDLDLHSVGPRTVEPLPFRAMSAYPYPPQESYPKSEVNLRYLSTFNTRWVR